MLMLKQMLEARRRGEAVYLADVRKEFAALLEKEREDIVFALTLLSGKTRSFTLSLPTAEIYTPEEEAFLSDYLYAQIYNILSALGGTQLRFYYNTANPTLDALIRGSDLAFCLTEARKDRRGYGRCINVMDRMLDVLCPGNSGFTFAYEDRKTMPLLADEVESTTGNFKQILERSLELKGKLICGLDVGGTDIKAVIVKDARIHSYKEYDWFPTDFRSSVQLVEPVCLIARLMLDAAALDEYVGADKASLEALAARALDKDANDAQMMDAAERIEAAVGTIPAYDAISVSFPDVCVADKIVGGEVYKTRGIRNNPSIDYETDFKVLTDLNVRLEKMCSRSGAVHIINDGSMAAFTAAMERAAAGDPVSGGILAHTLGTELGTGYMLPDGSIPDIPLEIYNAIIDLGSLPERTFEPDDLRSVNNFNTNLAGTLQKYTSQSGVFRLALKYYPKERPDLMQELEDKGFVVRKNGGYYVPTSPVDQRKPFLEHMMSLPDCEGDVVNARIWREVGHALAATWQECELILHPETHTRFLFGRLLKNRTCCRLMLEGICEKLGETAQFEIADAGLANTPLMKVLEADPNHTVAQFAQAIGAIYYAAGRC